MSRIQEKRALIGVLEKAREQVNAYLTRFPENAVERAQIVEALATAVEVANRLNDLDPAAQPKAEKRPQTSQSTSKPKIVPISERYGSKAPRSNILRRGEYR